MEIVCRLINFHIPRAIKVLDWYLEYLMSQRTTQERIRYKNTN